MAWGDSRVFASDRWQMTYGERAALEGLASAARPRLAIEIGTAQGGSLACIAAYAEEVHSFDLAPPADPVPAHVHLHTGDSRETLPRFLDQLARDHRTVDFALVDGDHSAAGVRADLENIVSSPAVDFALVVIHDTMNPEVRRGARAARLESMPRVVYANLDLVAGYLPREGPHRGQLWGGLGLVVVDSGGRPWRQSVYEDEHADPHELLRPRGPRAQLSRARGRLAEWLSRRRYRAGSPGSSGR